MPPPLLTICIPSHRPALCAEAVASVQAQTVPCGLLLSQSAEWWPSKINDLVSAVRSPYFAILPDDDLLAPTFAERIAEQLVVHSSPGLILCDYEVFGERAARNTCGPWEVGAFRHNNPLLGLTWGCHVETWQKVGQFDEALTYQDWDWGLRACLTGIRATLLAEPLVRYRYHPGQGSRVIDDAQAKAELRAKHPRHIG